VKVRAWKTKMNWHVYVQGAVIEAGARLDFTPQSRKSDSDPIPDLCAGDGLVIELANNVRTKGTVMNATPDYAVIKIRAVGWNIRRASAVENLVHAARGAPTVSWIVVVKVP
jgi:hypothetical protein